VGCQALAACDFSALAACDFSPHLAIRTETLTQV